MVKNLFTIVIINGTGASGKDTFVNLCANYASSVFNISTIDKVKEAARVLGWNKHSSQEDKSPEARKFLSDIKDAWVKYNDGSFKDIIERISGILNDPIDNPIDNEEPDHLLIFVHAREPEEIQKIKRHYGHEAITLLITGRDSGETQINHADLNVTDYPYAYIVENTGTLEELEVKAKVFTKSIVEWHGE